MPAHLRPNAKPAKGTAQKLRRARANTKLTARRRCYKLVDERDGRRCRICASWTGVQHHHIKKRSQGGADAPDNVLTVCGVCHRDIHEARLYVTGDATPKGLRVRMRLE